MNIYDVHLDPNCYIAPNCTLLGSIHIGKHSSVFPGATIRADLETVTIGSNSNVQENAIIHVERGFPCVIGNNVTIGHNAIVHACTINDNTIVGMGSIVMDGAVVGKNCVIGAGAVVSKSVIIPDNSIVIGLPGKVKRELTEAELEYNQFSADDYAAHAKEFAEAGVFYFGDKVPTNIPTICLA